MLGLFWKPVGPTSQSFLAQLKTDLKLPGKSREDIGHCGTLDPFAEGLLCVGFFEGTKLLGPLVGMDKSYRAKMSFDLSSNTLDVNGDLEWFEGCEVPTAEAFERHLKSQVGKFLQIPPQFSAKHIDGKRAHEWARQGVEKELAPKEVEILSVKFLERQTELLQGRTLVSFSFEVRVSSGTYIRCLARDFGKALTGKPGILLSLVRFSIGPWTTLSAEGTPRWLKEKDLSSLFKIQALSREEAELLVEQGRLLEAQRYRECSQPQLLVDPRGLAVAWLPANFEQKLGRVFKQNPFQRR